MKTFYLDFIISGDNGYKHTDVRWEAKNIMDAYSTYIAHLNKIHRESGIQSGIHSEPVTLIYFSAQEVGLRKENVTNKND